MTDSVRMQERRFISGRDCKLQSAMCKVQIGGGGIGRSSPMPAFGFLFCNSRFAIFNRLVILTALVVALFASSANAASGWFDDSFRRPIDVTWDADRASG